MDLLRNDLSLIAKEICVTKFRYLDTITHAGGISLQTSSEIRGRLPKDWKRNFAELFLSTLPAGSICGAPKAKTLSIIEQAEAGPRGYYTGVFGLYDGNDIYSAVAIRYIEKTDQGLYFRSGGGITHKSVLEEEYKELHDKIYIPVI